MTGEERNGEKYANACFLHPSETDRKNRWNSPL